MCCRWIPLCCLLACACGSANVEAPTCEGDAQCSAGFVCDPASHLCVATQSDAGTARDAGAADAATPVDCAPWQSADLGDIVAPGSLDCAAGVLTARGSGEDIWTAADSFFFAYQPFTGDVTITARIAEFDAAEPYAKAGVMIRGALDASAPYAFRGVTPNAASQLLSRATAGAEASSAYGQLGSTPAWVRLERRGGSVEGFESADGQAWTSIGTVAVALGPQAFVGLAVTSHANGTLAAATFDHVSLVGPAPIVCGDGSVNGDEQCETGECCNPATCRFAPDGTGCSGGGSCRQGTCVVGANALGAWVPSVGGTGPAAGFADGLVHIGKTQDPVNAATLARVGLARNETEPFQIVVPKRAGGYSAVRVTLTAPTDGQGHALKLFAFLQKWKRIDLPSYTYAPGGLDPSRQSDCNRFPNLFTAPDGKCWVPNGLVPFKLPSVAARWDGWQGSGENPSTTDFTIAADENQPLLFDVKVGAGRTAFPPGTYTGSVRITATPSGGAQTTVDVPVSVTVWDFELPSAPSFRTFIGLQQHWPANSDISDRLFSNNGAGAPRCAADASGNATAPCYFEWDHQVIDLLAEHRLSAQNAPPRFYSSSSSTMLTEMTSWLQHGAGSHSLGFWPGSRPASSQNQCTDKFYGPPGYGDGLPEYTNQTFASERPGMPAGMFYYVRPTDESSLLNLFQCGTHEYTWNCGCVNGVPPTSRSAANPFFRKMRAWAKEAHDQGGGIVITQNPSPELMYDGLDTQTGSGVDYFCSGGVVFFDDLPTSNRWFKANYSFADFDRDRGAASASTPESAATSHLCAYYNTGGWLNSSTCVGSMWCNSGPMPVHAIDFPGGEFRAGQTGFGAVAFGIGGMLSSDSTFENRSGANLWDPNEQLDGYEAAGRHDNSGGSFLFYPGAQVGWGNHLVPSLQLKHLRDGIEDFEYVEVLRRAGGYGPAEQAAVSAVGGSASAPAKASWSRVDNAWKYLKVDSASILHLRYQLGAKLHALQP